MPALLTSTSSRGVAPRHLGGERAHLVEAARSRRPPARTRRARVSRAARRRRARPCRACGRARARARRRSPSSPRRWRGRCRRWHPSRESSSSPRSDADSRRMRDRHRRAVDAVAAHGLRLPRPRRFPCEPYLARRRPRDGRAGRRQAGGRDQHQGLPVPDGSAHAAQRAAHRPRPLRLAGPGRLLHAHARRQPQRARAGPLRLRALLRAHDVPRHARRTRATSTTRPSPSSASTPTPSPRTT